MGNGFASNLKIRDTGSGHLYSGVAGNSRSEPNQKTGDSYLTPFFSSSSSEAEIAQGAVVIPQKAPFSFSPSFYSNLPGMMSMMYNTGFGNFYPPLDVQFLPYQMAMARRLTLTEGGDSCFYAAPDPTTCVLPFSLLPISRSDQDAVATPKQIG